MHNATQGFHVSIKLCIEGAAEMGSQVDMYTCTDQCIHFNQGIGPQAG